jgi:hypothetical protein
VASVHSSQPKAVIHLKIPADGKAIASALARAYINPNLHFQNTKPAKQVPPPNLP